MNTFLIIDAFVLLILQMVLLYLIVDVDRALKRAYYRDVTLLNKIKDLRKEF